MLALVGTALLLALLTAGCGRRTPLVDAGATPISPPPTVATQGLAEATAAPATTAAQTQAPTTTPANAGMGMPVPTPDLTAIQGCITEIDADLDVDARPPPMKGVRNEQALYRAAGTSPALPSPPSVAMPVFAGRTARPRPPTRSTLQAPRPAWPLCGRPVHGRTDRSVGESPGRRLLRDRSPADDDLAAAGLVDKAGAFTAGHRAR